MIAFLMLMQMTFTSDFSHYEVIIRKEHLFRPLGWVSPKQEKKYKLVGTRIADDGTGWAYFSFDGNRYVVNALRVGNDFDESVIKEITVRKVVMENGDVYELPATEFLSRTDKGSKRSKGRGSTSVQGDTSSGKREQRVETRTPRRSRRGRENLRQRWETFQSATPEERERMIKEFRQGRRRR